MELQNFGPNVRYLKKLNDFESLFNDFEICFNEFEMCFNDFEMLFNDFEKLHATLDSQGLFFWIFAPRGRLSHEAYNEE